MTKANLVGTYRGEPVVQVLSVGVEDIAGTFDSLEQVEEHVDRMLGGERPENGWACACCAERGAPNRFQRMLLPVLESPITSWVVCISGSFVYVAIGVFLVKGGWL